MNGNPFVIEEAQISVTLAGNGGIKIWIGGCAQHLILTDEFPETVLQYQGEPFETTKVTNELHKIEIENVWLLDTELSPPIMPFIRRGQILDIVIVWFDEDTGYWNKRTYYNVSGQIQRIGDTALQNLTYRAQRMLEESGQGEFDLTPSPLNQIVYVDSVNRVPLYSYNPDTDRYTAISDQVPALAEIQGIDDDSETWKINIGGQTVLEARPDGIHVVQLVANGSTSITPLVPSLEFWLGTRIASIRQDGTLACGNVTEEDSIETDPAGFILGGHVTESDTESIRGKLGLGGLFAESVFEDLVI